METETFIHYEVVDPITNKSFATKNCDDALYHFEKGCMVYKRHITTCNPTPRTQSRMIVTVVWHINPKEVYYEHDDQRPVYYKGLQKI